MVLPMAMFVGNFPSFAVTKSADYDGSTGYLSRTPGAAGSTQKWSFATWVRQDTTGAGRTFYSCRTGTGNSEIIQFTSANKLKVNFYDGASNATQLISTATYTSTSAWLHVLVAVDTTQGTASNRVKVYVNGTQVTAWDTETYCGGSYVTQTTNTKTHRLGCDTESAGSPGSFFDGLLAQSILVDGQQLTPASFLSGGNPIDLSGITRGTTGFLLTYTNSGALGEDEGAGTNDLSTTGTVAQSSTVPP